MLIYDICIIFAIHFNKMKVVGLILFWGISSSVSVASLQVFHLAPKIQKHVRLIGNSKLSVSVRVWMIDCHYVALWWWSDHSAFTLRQRGEAPADVHDPECRKRWEFKKRFMDVSLFFRNQSYLFFNIFMLTLSIKYRAAKLLLRCQLWNSAEITHRQTRHGHWSLMVAPLRCGGHLASKTKENTAGICRLSKLVPFFLVDGETAPCWYPSVLFSV